MPSRDEVIENLKQQLNLMNAKLAELHNAGEGQWDKASAEADKYYKALGHSFNYFKSQVK
jgi:hypothetical protein